MSRPLWLCLALLAVALTFVAVPFGGPVYDDLALIVRNPVVVGTPSVSGIVGQPLWGQDYPYWRPVSQALLALGWHAGGFAGIHVISLLLHLGSVGVLFRLAGRLGAGPRGAALAALLFGVHPVQVESVAWCSGINDPLWGLCALAAIDAFLAHRLAGGSGLPRRAVGWFVLGLLTKESALVIPLLIVAAEFALRASRGDRAPLRWRALWPLGAVILAWLAARVLVFGDLVAGFDRGPVVLDLAPLRRVSLPIEIFGRLLGALLWPWSPSTFRPMERELSWASAGLLWPALAVVLLLALSLVAWRRRHRAGLLAIALVAVPLLPGLAAPHTLNVYPVSDRYLYLAAAGLVLPWAAWLDRGRRIWVVVALAVALAFGVRSFTAVRTWSSQERFFDEHVARHPDDPRLLYTQAGVRLERFMSEGRLVDLAAAEAGFGRALPLALPVRYGGEHARARLEADIRIGLAWCAFAREARAPRPDWARVAALFAALVDQHETLAEAHIGLGSCLVNLGRLDDAERHLLRALQIDPARSEARHNLELLRQSRRR